MVEINWDDFKVRCSAISKAMSNSRDNPVLTEKQIETLAKYRKQLDGGKVLTENQKLEVTALEEKEENGKKIILSDTCIEYLMVEYAWITEKMIPVSKESLKLVAIEKGNKTQYEGMVLLTRLDKLPYREHKERVYNNYLSGQIDFYLGEDVMSAYNITDNKSSWDYPIFLKKINNGLESGQKEQVQGYMDITGAGDGYISNTLVDTPPEIIEDMKWRLAREMNATTTESPEFLEEWITWVRSMKFDHMPLHKRVNKIKIEPMGELYRVKLYDRVKIIRQWLSDFHERYQKMNLS
jgi:hypothetical protein